MITYLFVNQLKDIELLDMYYLQQIREAYRDETREDCFCVLKKEDIDIARFYFPNSRKIEQIDAWDPDRTVIYLAP
jgi:hypothetical protein